MSLILGMTARDTEQSVALAGTFVAPGLTVEVDEVAVRRTGYTGDLSELPIKAQLYRFDDTAWAPVGSPVALVRISHGVWSGGVESPTVTGGTTERVCIVAGLWSNVTQGSVVVLNAGAIGRRGVPGRFVRAAS